MTTEIVSDGHRPGALDLLTTSILHITTVKF